MFRTRGRPCWVSLSLGRRRRGVIKTVVYLSDCAFSRRQRVPVVCAQVSRRRYYRPVVYIYIIHNICVWRYAYAVASG